MPLFIWDGLNVFKSISTTIPTKSLLSNFHSTTERHRIICSSKKVLLSAWRSWRLKDETFLLIFHLVRRTKGFTKFACLVQQFADTSLVANVCPSLCGAMTSKSHQLHLFLIPSPLTTQVRCWNKTKWPGQVRELILDFNPLPDDLLQDKGFVYGIKGGQRGHLGGSKGSGERGQVGIQDFQNPGGQRGRQGDSRDSRGMSCI